MSAQDSTNGGDEQQTTNLSMSDPAVVSGMWGTLKTFWRWRKAKKNRRKKASKGYVQWYLIDDTMPEAKYVKPDGSGAGIPEYDKDGERYVFPREAAVMDRKSGMWTFIHVKGAADPINLRDPSKLAIRADALKEYASMLVTASPPGLLDRYNINTDNLLLYAIVGIIAFAFIQQVLG